MVVRRPFERARRLARDVLWECGVDEPSKIDPFKIVGRRKIKVTYGKLEGATARIFRNGDRAIIRVSDQIVQLGRLRFTIAHEVGHFLLGHKIPSELDIDANAPSPYSAHQEREANAFAVEHNTPEAWVQPYCNVTPVNLDAVRAIASAFKSSNVAAALRLVSLSSEACAVAFTKGGRIAWARRSRAFPARIPEHMDVGRGSVAFDYHDHDVLDAAVRTVSACTWLGSKSRTAVGARIMEHAELVPEPGWEGVMSLLWIPRASSRIAA
jgi:Zn-dependent peptidase ImmA (M78 family)